MVSNSELIHTDIDYLMRGLDKAVTGSKPYFIVYETEDLVGISYSFKSDAHFIRSTNY